MPRLWTETIQEHRRAVGSTIMDTTARLVAEHGPRAVTMSRIAEESGIGRATLYKYFPDVETILATWHERRVDQHLEHLAHLGEQPGTPSERLATVLTAYALMRREQHGHPLAPLLHHGEHASRALRELHAFVENLVSEGARSGELRDDVPPGELAPFCLNALITAADLQDEAAVHRLVDVTLSALRRRA